MKQTIKRISILLILAVLVFSLCGCDALDEMRQHQLFLKEDGSFYFQGSRYLPLETNEYFSPIVDYLGEPYYITEPDVPVLLSTSFCKDTLRFSEDMRFAQSYYSGLRWYCREDLYEEIQEKNNQPFLPDTFFYTMSIYDGNLGEYVQEYYTLTQTQWDAIQTVLAGEPLQLSDGVYISFDWGLSLTEASADGLFQYEGPSIMVAGDTYYLEVYSNDGEVTYEVPAELEEIFDQITASYRDAYGH